MSASVKGCVMPALTRERVLYSAVCGQASHKPQWRKPRRVPLLWRLEWLAGEPRRRCWRSLVAGDEVMTWSSSVEGRFVMPARASQDAGDAHATIVRYRDAATESGQERGGHATARKDGGARIDGA